MKIIPIRLVKICRFGGDIAGGRMVPFFLLLFALAGNVIAQDQMEKNYTDFQNAARLAIAGNGTNILITAPFFQKAGSKLNYSFGRVFVRASWGNPYATERWRQLFEAQLTNEQLKHSLATNSSFSPKDWSPFLGEADHSILLVFAVSMGDKTDNQELVKQTDLLWQHLPVVYEAMVEKFARTQHLSLQNVHQIKSKTIEVSFVSKPPGAEMQIVKELFAINFKDDQHTLELLWLDVTGGDSIPIDAGQYTYRARWSKADPWDTGNILLMAGGPKQICKKN